MAKATFGAGCFWGVEAAFRRIDGVTDAAVGYAGGHKENPSYREVCSGGTGLHDHVQPRQFGAHQRLLQRPGDSVAQCDRRQCGQEGWLVLVTLSAWLMLLLMFRLRALIKKVLLKSLWIMPIRRMP